MNFKLWQENETIRLKKLIDEYKNRFAEADNKLSQIVQAMEIIKNYPVPYQILKAKAGLFKFDWSAQHIEDLELRVKRLASPIFICDEAKFESARKALFQKCQKAGLFEYNVPFSGGVTWGDDSNFDMANLHRFNIDIVGYTDVGRFDGHFVSGYFYFSSNLLDEEIEEHQEQIVWALSNVIEEHA